MFDINSSDMPKIVDHELYRKELLRKSFDLFASKGYAAITMREIAQGLNVSTGTLYHYFPSKKELFMHLVEEITEENLSIASAELEGLETLEERLETIGKFLEKYEDVFIKQSFVMMDFYKHQDAKDMLESDMMRELEKRLEEVFKKCLGFYDPLLACFVDRFIDGLVMGKIWCNNIDFVEQLKLLGKMIRLYIDHEGIKSKY
jgi:AcrR family transcriptional regulator